MTLNLKCSFPYILHLVVFKQHRTVMAINLQRIVGNQLSGIEMDEIEFLSEFANNLENENWDVKINQFTGLLNETEMDVNEELPELSSDVLAEIEKIEKDCRIKSTDDATL